MPLANVFISCGLNLLSQYHWDRSDDKDFNIKYFSTNGIAVRIKLAVDCRLWKFISGGRVSSMDGCVVDGIARLHNTAIRVEPAQEL